MVKNLLYLARLTEALGRFDDLVWLAKKIMKEANMEVISNVKIIKKVSHMYYYYQTKIVMHKETYKFIAADANVANDARVN